MSKQNGVTQPTEKELREIDAEIGELLFNIGASVGLMKRGYFYRPNANGYTALATEAGRYSLEEAKKHEHVRGEEDDVIIVRFDTPRYSSNAADAMAVLKKCVERLRPTDAIVIGQALNVKGMWHVSNVRPWPVGRIKIAPTLELAICQFALQLFKEE